ncbi:MAG: hypothetical protein ACRDQH_12815 [Pseudonocardiaceae bacterium]
MLTGIPADAMAGIDPAGIAAYLQASGWSEAGSYGRAAIWTRLIDGAEAEVLVPVSAELRDYPARLAELVGALSTVHQRPVSDVLQDLRSARLDVQYIRMMPDGPSGSTPLHEGYLAVKGVHDLFLAAATSAVSSERPTVLPSQKPPQARGFVDQVRLGQTSRGSYVLRVETPLPLEFFEQPVPSREVLLHLYQATSAAHEAAARSSQNDDPTPFIERVGDGVSANLCDALVDIGGQRQSSFDIRFDWAPVSPVQLKTPAVRFDRPVIAALKAGAKFLRKLPVAETATVTGRVVDLHRTPMDRLGRVQVEGGVDEAGQRHEGRVTMRLAPRDYDIAVSAHRDQSPLRVVGELRHTGRQFEISRVSSVEIIPLPPS